MEPFKMVDLLSTGFRTKSVASHLAARRRASTAEGIAHLEKMREKSLRIRIGRRLSNQNLTLTEKEKI